MSGLQRRTGLGRSGPLSRGDKPLTRTAPLSQGCPAKQADRKLQASRDLARQAKPRTKRPKPDLDPLPDRRPAMTGATAAVKEQVRKRDGGLCVRCNQPATDQDHRSGRGMGGRKGRARDRNNGVAWLLTLCGAGNASGCHGWKEANREEAERLGYRIARNGPEVDAATVPVLTFNGWWLFTADGDKVPSLAPPDCDAREVAA